MEDTYDEDESVYEGQVAIDHTYAFPIVIGDITILTLSSLENNSGAFMEHLIETFGQDKGMLYHTDLWDDLTHGSCAETMDAAARDLMFFLMSHTPVVALAALPPELEAAKDLVTANAINSALPTLHAAVMEMSLDDPLLTSAANHVAVPTRTVDPAEVIIRPQSRCPPYCPDTPGEIPCILRFTKNTNMSTRLCRNWIDTLNHHVGLDKENYVEPIGSVASTSHSNYRPSKYGSVLLVWSDGTPVNIGSHPYKLTDDYDIELDFTNCTDALEELFSAPGGEGLACATPSHMLHQMISAILSHAIVAESPGSSSGHTDWRGSRWSTPELKPLDVACEHGGSDITISGVDENIVCMNTINIDVTSSAGIWLKKLEPTTDNPKWRHQAAISKYDVAACLVDLPFPPVVTCLMKAVASSLALEYPDFWIRSYDNDPKDLRLQQQIYHKLAGFSRENTRKLGIMSHKAAIDLCLDEMREYDTNAKGEAYISKKDSLQAKISTLKPRANIAFPPVPIGDLSLSFVDPISCQVAGHNFVAGSPLLSDTRSGHKYKMDSQAEIDYFLKNYPAIGIISHEDSKSIAHALSEKPITVTGGARGAGFDYNGPEHRLMTAASEIHSCSSSAQFAEIRADVCRRIDDNPAPGIGVWVQSYVYNNRVCIWYRLRDNVNSPEGYRADWFAVSRFEVAGSIKIDLGRDNEGYLWPRQRLRSQEFDFVKNTPRRLKATLFSMIEKMTITKSTPSEVILAWERMAMTSISSTWKSGENFLTCRYLSASLSAPSSPFDKMAKKLVDPATFADVFYLCRLSHVLDSWSERDQYHSRCPLLGLPKAFSQLESYWVMWIPDGFADSKKNMAECVIALNAEAQALEDTMYMRVRDLQAQVDLLDKHVITCDDLRESLAASTSLDTDERFGWSFIGSLASGCALEKKRNPALFDRQFAKGFKSRRMIDHLSVRHSARIDKRGNLEKGTVAEMMLNQGTDIFLSKVDQVYRFIFESAPIFFNHPKYGEHKNREISITDPDSRINLSDAEVITGLYGKGTNVDFLKKSNKDQIFYKNSEHAMEAGGAIQSSDATRYGPMMSNYAIAIMLLFLGLSSMHLRWAGVVYATLAHRIMIVSDDIIPDLDKKIRHADTSAAAVRTRNWIQNMNIIAYDGPVKLRGYCTSHHMGQGMSHHASSLLHAGGLLVAHEAADMCKITVNRVRVKLTSKIMVTSDDATSIVSPDIHFEAHVARAARQRASRIYLGLMSRCRKIALRMVSVKPNLVKEVISGTRGEFNSNDTGIGNSCPILGFRELIANIVIPSSPSLIGDFINAAASAKNIAMAGQGIITGSVVHAILIDSVEYRWKLTATDKQALIDLSIIPNELLIGCRGDSLVNNPAAWLCPLTRTALISISAGNNAHAIDIDPHTQDTVFGPLMHIKVAMKKQHVKAIHVIKAYGDKLRRAGLAMRMREMVHGPNLLDSCLRATMSSARTRNLGRIGTKIRNRDVTPRDYFINDCVQKFQKASVFHNTMAWLTRLDAVVRKTVPDAASSRYADITSTTVAITNRGMSGFPNPPTRRRPLLPSGRKPQYATSGYGATPFGKHALERSHTVSVDAIGPAERRAMQDYLTHTQVRGYSEHVEYGGTFVTSWAKGESGKVVAMYSNRQCIEGMTEETKYGDFSEAGTAALRALASQAIEDAGKVLPVLALHKRVGKRCTFHCVHLGRAYNVTANVSLEVGESMSHMGTNGVESIIVNQGEIELPVLESMAPTREEVAMYQRGSMDEVAPSLVKKLEDESISAPKSTLPTYSTVVRHNNEDVLVYHQPRPPKRLSMTMARNTPYFRSGIIADLATEGYWHSQIKGVCFRAYLKQAYHGETIWTGGVYGWRNSSTSCPTYQCEGSRPSCVTELFILGGLSSPEMVESYRPDRLARSIAEPTYQVVFGSNQYQVNRIFAAGQNLVEYMVSCNYGTRHRDQSRNDDFMKIEYSPMSVPGTTDHRIAYQQILDALSDVEGEGMF